MKQIFLSLAVLASIAGGIFIFNACSDDEQSENNINNQLANLPKSLAGDTAEKYWTGSENDLTCYNWAQNCLDGVTITASRLDNIVEFCDNGTIVDYFTENESDLYHYFSVDIVKGVIDGSVTVTYYRKSPRTAIVFRRVADTEDLVAYMIDD